MYTYPPQTELFSKDLGLGFCYSDYSGENQLSWRRPSKRKSGEWTKPDFKVDLVSPFSRICVGNQILNKDKEFFGCLYERYGGQSFYKLKKDIKKFEIKAPFKSVYDGHTVETELTATVTRWIKAPRFMTWKPFRFLLGKCKKQYSEPQIDIVFAQPVGRGVGTWKGGVCGHGTSLLPGESYEQSVIRYVLTRPHDWPRLTLEDLPRLLED